MAWRFQDRGSAHNNACRLQVGSSADREACGPQKGFGLAGALFGEMKNVTGSHRFGAGLKPCLQMLPLAYTAERNHWHVDSRNYAVDQFNIVALETAVAIDGCQENFARTVRND